MISIDAAMANNRKASSKAMVPQSVGEGSRRRRAKRRAQWQAKIYKLCTRNDAAPRTHALRRLSGRIMGKGRV